MNLGAHQNYTEGLVSRAEQSSGVGDDLAGAPVPWVDPSSHRRGNVVHAGRCAL